MTHQLCWALMHAHYNRMGISYSSPDHCMQEHACVLATCMYVLDAASVEYK
jgi:hypothetical protein